MSGRYFAKKIPIALEWPIHEESLDELYSNGQCLRSEAFAISKNSDVQYYLEIYPKGDTEERDGETWIFMCLEYSSKAEIEAKFNISIESANFFSNKKCVFEELGGYGAKICTAKELFDPVNRYFVNDKMFIKMEGTLSFHKKTFKNKYMKVNDHTVLLGRSLWEQENKDFTIVVDEEEINVHKWVIAAQSPVFAKMFESGTKEAKENKVHITDYSYDAVEAAVLLCYNIEFDTEFDEKMQRLQFCDKYKFQMLKNKTESLLISEIDESNVCLLANCSLLSNAPNLQDKCFEFLRDCLQKSTPVADIDILDKEFALKLLKNAFYHVSQ